MHQIQTLLMGRVPLCLMSLNNLLKLLRIMLFILCLITYFMPPVEGQQILSNITDLLSSAFINQTTTPLNNTAVTAAFRDYTPLNNTDMATVLRDTTQAIDAQIPGIEATSANP